jgi:hypothetical protein
MEAGMTIKSNVAPELRGSRIRSWVYWLSAVASTLLYLLSTVTMLMVPGIRPSTKIGMLAVVVVGAALSLGVGIWRFGSTEAPATLWPLGPVSGVVLLLEIAHCVVGIFVLAIHP